jgi:hypothetical protein
MEPTIRGYAMDAGYRMTKDAWAPYFASARSFKDTVAWRITFDSDRVELGRAALSFIRP